MRVIACYLPQFHEIPENNEWWGEGFTEWTNVKTARPLYSGHYQPREPINDNYYDLLNDDVKEWQVSIAKKNGIYGFCFYHYWFDGKMLLEKPVEQFLKNKNLDINFCLSWANEPWTKAWVSKNDSILIEQNYGNEENWEKHFDYLLPFFKDSRYICNDGKPLFVIYRPEQIGCLNEMLDYWQILAKKNGLAGIDFAYQHIDFDLLKDKDDSRFAYNIEYEPLYAMNDMTNPIKKFLISSLKFIDNFTQKIVSKKASELYLKKVRTLSYDDVWAASLIDENKDKKKIAGAFVDWDNTPRRGTKGLVIKDATPDKFYKYFDLKIKQVKKSYSTDMIFIFAWNEWAEGGYLEPDKKFNDNYLKSVKEALANNDELR
ncbi:glycoside hydrolase family 99-like domain-containing protein [Enterococcus faecium]|uniref:glycosyltransferase WbsX family protein n=4 Tax=Enterococcus faecium TaxID=1352 RepID=UPI001560B44E|nr:glycoside hydrolase family 99-like domain-containing protein [Enterococcus faecium]NRE71161.1 glycoside hydrolase family 99-like domain-containing protein [Enterococcus faecium]